MSQARPLTPPVKFRRLRRAGRWIATAIALGLAWLAIHLAVMYWFGLSDDTRPTDVGVVLGNFVDFDGTPGPVVLGRLERALELYRAGCYAHIIVSGAIADGGYDEPAGMQRYLVQHGVPEEAILADRGGTNTYLTALNTRRLMREHGWHSVTIVSDFYHILRTRLAFYLMGIENVRSAHAQIQFQSNNYFWAFREFAAFYRYLFHAYPPESRALTWSPTAPTRQSPQCPDAPSALTCEPCAASLVC